jgi:hypothetical protein
VVFGKVIKGFDVLTLCESYGTKRGKPLGKVEIMICGEVEDIPEKKYPIERL